MKKFNFYNLSDDHGIFAFLLGFATFLSVGPYFIWGQGYFKFYVLGVALFFLYLLLQIKIEKSSIYVSFFFVFLIFLFNLPHIHSSYFLNSSLLLILIFLLLNERLQARVFEAFYFIFSLTLVPAILVWILSFVGIVWSWEELKPISDSKDDAGVFYLNYFVALALSSEIYSTGIGITYRLAALYDEPGVVGTFCALLLIANRGQLNSISSKIILIGGILSFSLAFYILIFIYFFFKKTWLLIKALILSTVILWIFYDMLIEYELFSRFFFERLNGLISDPMSVDNRVDSCFLKVFYNFLSEGQYFFGNGPWAHTKLGCDASSYLVMIFNHGIIGMFMVFIFYVVLFLKTFKGFNLKSYIEILPFILAFTLSLYQRPDFITLAMIVIFVGACLSHSKNIQSNKIR